MYLLCILKRQFFKKKCFYLYFIPGLEYMGFFKSFFFPCFFFGWKCFLTLFFNPYFITNNFYFSTRTYIWLKTILKKICIFCSFKKSYFFVTKKFPRNFFTEKFFLSVTNFFLLKKALYSSKPTSYNVRIYIIYQIQRKKNILYRVAPPQKPLIFKWKKFLKKILDFFDSRGESRGIKYKKLSRKKMAARSSITVGCPKINHKQK